MSGKKDPKIPFNRQVGKGKPNYEKKKIKQAERKKCFPFFTFNGRIRVRRIEIDPQVRASTQNF